MTIGLKPYPVYKDSGVEGLGEMPAHWQTLLNQRIFRETTRPYGGTGETQLSVSQRDGLIPTARMTERSLQTASYDNWKIALPGDLVLNRFKAHLGVFFAATIRGIVTFHYAVFRPKTALETKYFELLFHTPAYRAVYGGRSNGMTVGLQNLSNQNFYNVQSVVPPLPEQSAIVRFLDHMDRRIRRYIRAKQKLIKLLEEQKQAIIHRAVTRGLDPSVRLKPSGLECLGVVPAHWDVRQLGRFITLQRGFDITKEQQNDGAVPVVSSGGISSYDNRSTSPGPGVVIGRKGPVGTVHFLCDAFWAHDTTLWVKAFNGNHPRFVYYVLCRLDLKRFDTGSANPTINRNLVHPEVVSFPPPEEQRMIASFLDGIVNQTGRMIGDAVREIALLREYRTRLVADVVTGKLDVREAAARLPEETGDAEEAGLIDENGEGKLGEVEDAEQLEQDVAGGVEQ